jgi:hypothetical protein
MSYVHHTKNFHVLTLRIAEVFVPVLEQAAVY